MSVIRVRVFPELCEDHARPQPPQRANQFYTRLFVHPDARVAQIEIFPHGQAEQFRRAFSLPRANFRRASSPRFATRQVERLADSLVDFLDAQFLAGMPQELGEGVAHRMFVDSPAADTAKVLHGVDGPLELEEGGLRVTLIKAVMRATERARELAPPPETKS